jgi:hypothetical protein
VKDRWRGFIRGLREGRLDQLADHSILAYIEHIRAALQTEELARSRIHLPDALSTSIAPAPIKRRAQIPTPRQELRRAA